MYGFELASDLKINFDKSSVIVFADNPRLQVEIASILNCKSGSLTITCLGVTLKPDKLLHEDWIPMLTKIGKRLASWKGNTLSRRGRLVLVNSLLSSMPLYMMSFHKYSIWDEVRRSFF